MSIHDVVPDKAHVLRLWPLALAALILAYLIQNVRSYRRLSMFPGPKLAAVSNLWNFSVELTGKNFKIWEETCEKYGEMFVRSYVIDRILTSSLSARPDCPHRPKCSPYL